VIVNVRGVPVHSVPPFKKLGVTVIVAVTGAFVVLIAVNEAMLPLPLAPSPIEVLLFVHVYTVPVTAPLKATAVVAAPLQSVWFDTAFTVGVGFTVIV
jgi:hypothetical protein